MFYKMKAYAFESNLFFFTSYCKYIFNFLRCEKCNDWNQLLDNLAKKMKHSGNNDVAIGKIDCSANKKLCNGKISAFQCQDIDKKMNQF